VLENPFYFEEDAKRERRILRRFVGWVLFLLCMVLAGVAVSLHAQEPVRCAEGYCLISQEVLKELSKLAGLADEYRSMCGWP
jgi:hypothetical protein